MAQIAQFTALLLALAAAVQVAVAAGAPWSAFVYGGRAAPPGQPLPPRQRTASALSATILLSAALAPLVAAGVVDGPPSVGVARVICGALAALCALNTVANLASRHWIERRLFAAQTALITLGAGAVSAVGPAT